MATTSSERGFSGQLIETVARKVHNQGRPFVTHHSDGKVTVGVLLGGLKRPRSKTFDNPTIASVRLEDRRGRVHRSGQTLRFTAKAAAVLTGTSMLHGIADRSFKKTVLSGAGGTALVMGLEVAGMILDQTEDSINQRIDLLNKRVTSAPQAEPFQNR
jgi:hypothetical protein